MLMTLLSVAGVSLILLAILFHGARNLANRRKGEKRAKLIRLRLQDQPTETRRVYREVPIRLGQH
jgi:hypothetical protein